MLTHSPPIESAIELAQQFERQGICCTDADSPPQLWCSYCTAYIEEKTKRSQDHAQHTNEGSKSSQRSRQRSRSQTHASEPGAPLSPSPVIIASTKNAVLEHCAARLHLHLYEHGTQANLRHWCPVELHGYRMLLNHHCVYPAHMFGNGRLLMDLTIAGGMLIGQDVCGGVKLWPQHRYAAAELVLPSSRSGVRKVWVPALEPESSETNVTPSSFKRPKGEGQHLQLIHEDSEIPPEVAWAYNNEARSEEQETMYFRKNYASVLQFVPRYWDEEHGLRSRRVMEGSLTTVLDATNDSIMAEARLREQRRAYSIKHNLIENTDNTEPAMKKHRSTVSEDA